MPQFAIVTPSYQQGRFLERTIQSVLRQQGIESEYFVADGGSTDESVAILTCHERRLRFVSEADRGQSHAVNKGIAATSAPIIGWLNSDDVYYPGALRAVADFLDTHPEIDLVYGRADHLDEHGGLLEPYPTEAWDPDRLTETCFLCQPAVFFRRRVVEQWGGLDESLHYCMDYEYWIRLGRAGARFGFLDRTLAGSRMYASNKTLSAPVEVNEETNDMLKRTLGRVPDRWILNFAHAITRQRRNGEEHTFGFTLSMSREAWKASMRWNGRLSPRVAATIAGWLKSGMIPAWPARKTS